MKIKTLLSVTKDKEIVTDVCSSVFDLINHSIVT